MMILALVIGVVLGVLATLLAVQHRREAMEAVSLRRYNDVISLYLLTLQRYSVKVLNRYKPTHTPTSGQKRLLAELDYAGQLIGAVNGHFLVDVDNTVLDRNGCIELWVYTQDNVAEVYLLPANAVPIVTGAFADINQLFNKHLTTGTA